MAARLATEQEKAALMAPSSSAASAAAQGNAAADAEALDVLHPNRTVEVGGRIVTVREYGYIEGISLLPACGPFLDALYALAVKTGPAPPIESLEELLGIHAAVVQWLVAQSVTPIDRDNPEAFAAAVADNTRWVAGLDDVDGALLMIVWWRANRHFFIRRLRRRAEAVRMSGTSESANSTQH
jgi:hypothetical protein